MKYLPILLILLLSCGIFEPRNPEDPNQGGSNFLPATSAQVLLQNFTTSFEEKNTDNYVTCFSETGIGGASSFSFTASADARAAFASIFQDWGIQNERQFFVTMISNIQEGLNPSINFSNSGFEFLSPDSAIYIADYEMIIPHSIEEISKNYIGTMQLVMYPEANNIWIIRSWTDIANNQNDDKNNTISYFKAQLFNR